MRYFLFGSSGIFRGEEKVVNKRGPPRLPLSAHMDQPDTAHFTHYLFPFTHQRFVGKCRPGDVGQPSKNQPMVPSREGGARFKKDARGLHPRVPRPESKGSGKTLKGMFTFTFHVLINRTEADV